MTRIYLVRHGQTEWNMQRRFQGHLGVSLSAEGRAQADAVGRWLAAQPGPIRAIYASNLPRAAETAEAIGARLGVPPILTPALREIHCGAWEGLSGEEIEAAYPGQLAAWNATVDRFTLPGGESVPVVQRRVSAFYREVLVAHAGETVVLVSHGVALSALQAAIFGWDLVETWQTLRGSLANSGVTLVAVDPATGVPTLALANSLAHLAADGSLPPPSP